MGQGLHATLSRAHDIRLKPRPPCMAGLWLDGHYIYDLKHYNTFNSATNSKLNCYKAIPWCIYLINLFFALFSRLFRISQLEIQTEWGKKQNRKRESSTHDRYGFNRSQDAVIRAAHASEISVISFWQNVLVPREAVHIIQNPATRHGTHTNHYTQFPFMLYTLNTWE